MQTQLSGTYDGMKANFQSLMQRYDEKILEYGQHGRQQMEKPSNKLIGELNKLKLQRARIKGIWMDMETMTEQQILDLKTEYDEDYKAAYRLLGDNK